jgi:hypothetical protein
VLNVGILDEIIKVKAEDAFSTARILAQTEGLLVAFPPEPRCMRNAACQTPENAGKNIVVLLPDSGNAICLPIYFSNIVHTNVHTNSHDLFNQRSVQSMEQQRREYGLFTTIAMIVGIVIGSGIFFKSDNMLGYTGGNVGLAVLVSV